MISSDPSYPLFSIFAFLGFVLAITPLPWHLEAWNSGTCIYMFWASFACLVQFVNSVVWHGNIENRAPVWCDISSKFMIGAAVGIPAASLCINRRLYYIATMKTASITRAEKQRTILIDTLIGVGVPVLVMAMHYVVQGHRFDILEDVGCTPVIINTAAAYPLVFVWPSVLGAASFVYAALSLRAFWARRMQFKKLLASHSSMTVNRYFRLMCLASVDMLTSLPLSLYGIYINNVGVPLVPYINWENIHFNFSRVNAVPAFLWRGDHAFLISVELDRWVYPLCALLFFALFGFAEEARKHYRMAIMATLRPLGLPQRASETHHLSGSLPVFTPSLPSNRKHAPSFTSSTIDISCKGRVPIATKPIVVNIASEKTVDPPSAASSEFSLPEMHGLGSGSLDIPPNARFSIAHEHIVGIAVTSSTPTTVAFSPRSSLFSLSSTSTASTLRSSSNLSLPHGESIARPAYSHPPVRF